MARQMYAVTGDPRLRRRNQTAALNARLGLLPQILNRQREDERFEYQKSVDEKRLGIQRQSARDAREAADREHQLGLKQLEQQKKADRTAMGIKGFGAALNFLDGGSLFGGDEASNVAGSYSGSISKDAKTASSSFNPSTPGVLNQGQVSQGIKGFFSGTSKPTTPGAAGGGFAFNKSSPISGSPAGGFLDTAKGALTKSSTLGAGLAGFGAGSLFGKKKPLYGALAGAAAGGLMNLFGGGGQPGMYDDMMSMFSGGIGGALSSMF